MDKEKKFIIKHVIQTLVELYEECDVLPQDTGIELFKTKTLELYKYLFRGASPARPYPKYEKDGDKKPHCNYLQYLDDDNGIVKFKHSLGREDYIAFLQIMKGLKNELLKNNLIPIMVLGTQSDIRNNFDGSVTMQCIHSVVSARTNSWGGEWEFNYGKEKTGSEVDPAGLYDFWDYLWAFQRFLRSALVTYQICMGSFEAVKVCEYCGKMHIPRRAGAKRGIFCSKKCQKDSYNKYHKKQNCCIAKQRQYLTTRLDIAIALGHESGRIFETIPSIDKCRMCTSISSGKVKSGECPSLAESEIIKRLVEEYNSMKIKIRNDKKLAKQMQHMDYDYSVMRPVPERSSA